MPHGPTTATSGSHEDDAPVDLASVGEEEGSEDNVQAARVRALFVLCVGGLVRRSAVYAFVD